MGWSGKSFLTGTEIYEVKNKEFGDPEKIQKKEGETPVGE